MKVDDDFVVLVRRERRLRSHDLEAAVRAGLLLIESGQPSKSSTSCSRARVHHVEYIVVGKLDHFCHPSSNLGRCLWPTKTQLRVELFG